MRSRRASVGQNNRARTLGHPPLLKPIAKLAAGGLRMQLAPLEPGSLLAKAGEVIEILRHAYELGRRRADAAAEMDQTFAVLYVRVGAVMQARMTRQNVRMETA